MIPAAWWQGLPFSGQAPRSRCGIAAASLAFLPWHKVNLLNRCCSCSSRLSQAAQGAEIQHHSTGIPVLFPQSSDLEDASASIAEGGLKTWCPISPGSGCVRDLSCI